MNVAPDRLRKGQLKMRGLATSIRHLYDACGSVRGSVHPGGILELDELDDVINALDNALVSVRTIDLEVLEPSDATAYRAARANSPTGGVVRGLTPLRNNAVHHVDVVDPDLARAVGPLPGGTCAIFPRWKDRALLPTAMVEHHDRRRLGQLHIGYANSYDTAVAGRLLVDTLMDAYAFFESCDPALVERDAENQIAGFPLPPRPFGAGYVRLHPDWPTQEHVDGEIRTRTRSALPKGRDRQIRGLLIVGDTVVCCGYTDPAGPYARSFTEPVGQIVADVDAGFEYFIELDGTTDRVSVHDGVALADGRELASISELMLTGDDQEPWRGWWTLCQNDAHYYQAQREQT